MLENIKEYTKKYLEEKGVTIKELSERMKLRGMKFDRTTISRYLGDKYGSDTTNIEKALEAYFEMEEKEKETEENGGIKENAEGSNEKTNGRGQIDFFESRDAVNIIAVCDLCQRYMRAGVIVGKSGFGKTYALKRYAKFSRVCYLRCDDSMTCQDFVYAIERAIGLPRGNGTVRMRIQSIKDFFSINEGYLLIVDEADKLMTKYSAKKIEILRTIYDQDDKQDEDQRDMGMVIAGEPALEDMLRRYLPRFSSRCNYCIKLFGLNEKEITKYLQDYALTDGARKELILRGSNSQTGCFRLLNRTLENLMRISDGNRELTEKDIKIASNMMML